MISSKGDQALFQRYFRSIFFSKASAIRCTFLSDLSAEVKNIHFQ